MYSTYVEFKVTLDPRSKLYLTAQCVRSENTRLGNHRRATDALSHEDTIAMRAIDFLSDQH